VQPHSVLELFIWEESVKQFPCVFVCHYCLFSNSGAIYMKHDMQEIVLGFSKARQLRAWSRKLPHMYFRSIQDTT